MNKVRNTQQAISNSTSSTIGHSHPFFSCCMLTALCLLLQVGLNILRAALIVHRVNAAVAVFPGVAAAPLLLGTVGGAGGKVISDAVNVAIGASKGKHR